MDRTTALEQLVNMSLELARPENEYVILGEGNTSAKIDADSFYVKASGAYLCNSAPDMFVEVRRNKALELLDCGEIGDMAIKEHLASASVENSKLRPSVETVLHAFCLGLPDVNFIGHTHPTAVNAILCSNDAERVVGGRIFPDEIVYCGIRPVFIPYIDPGVKLARELRARTLAFMEKEGIPPKVILMQNHGFIALGKNPHEVLAITAMWVKTAKVLAGAQLFGGVHYFTEENVARIHTRPDEVYRKGLLH